MFNSTPGLDGLITWANDRFTAAGLTPPTVTEVSFYGEHLDVCKGTDGRIYGLATGTTLSLCFVEKTACTDPATCTQWTAQAKSTALHEIGHVWIWAGLDSRAIDDDTTRRFTKEAGLPTWADTDHDWRDRGMELAAATISWALTDDPFVHPFFADRCDDLGSLFTTLTGKPAPTTAQCPEVTSHPA